MCSDLTGFFKIKSLSLQVFLLLLVAVICCTMAEPLPDGGHGGSHGGHGHAGGHDHGGGHGHGGSHGHGGHHGHH